MNEYTNQTPETTNETTDAFDYFGVEEETTEPTSEEVTETAETETKAESETKTIEDFLKIKYNGAEKSLTREEAIELAQKGMNYDKVHGELQNYKNSNELHVLSELAKSAGVSMSDYLARLQSFQNQAAIDNIKESIKAKYPDAPEELINDLAKTQFEKNTSEKKHKETVTANQKQNEERERLVKQVEALEKAYPDVDVNKLPSEVIEMAQQGETLLGAYRAYELKQAKAELEALKKNETNKAKTTGSMSSHADAVDDLFESAWMSQF